MKKYSRKRLCVFLKQLATMNVMEFIRGLPAQGISWVCAALLSIMATFPVLLSLIFQEPLENASHIVEVWEYQRVNVYALSRQWHNMLMNLSFPLALVAWVICARNIDSKKSLSLFCKNKIKTNLLPIGLLLMLVWSVPSALLSGNLRLCFMGNGYRHEGVFTYCFYALIFIGALQVSDKHMKWVMEILCAVCATTGLIVIANGKIFPGLFYVDVDPHAAMFHNSNHYGYYLAICFPVCFGLCLEDRGDKISKRVIRMMEFVLTSYAVAFSNCRGAFLGIIAALIGWNLCVFIQHKNKWKTCLVLDVVFAVTILLLKSESNILLRFSILVEEFETIHQEESLEAIDVLGSGRGVLWRLGIQFALEKPLFGHGPDNLGYAYTAIQSGLSDRPHNEMIQFAASLGFPALVFYLIAIGSHIVTFFCCFRRLSIVQLSLFASVGSYLVNSIFGNTMYYTTPYYIMMLAFSYRVCNPQNLKAGEMNFKKLPKTKM